MKVYDELIQGTDEWLRVRAGKFTASKDFQQLVSGRADTYQKLIRLKAAEKITGQLKLNDFTNGHIERGKELEQEAREAFEMEAGLSIRQVGFVENDEWSGASPDGFIGDDMGIEIKCRDIDTHLECFLSGYDKSYKYQIQGNLWVTGRKQWYFVSYNPYYAHIGKHLYKEIIERDESLISQIENGVKKGIDDVKRMIKLMEGLK